jgi:hypothetical protein
MMVESKALKADEALLYKNADAQLSGLLVKELIKSSKNQALVILLDTCEILSLALEEFLRDAIVCPAVEQGSALVFIVSGRFSQYRERQVEDNDGNRKSVKGYADRLNDPPPIPWDLSTFADPEIADYLRESSLDPQPELIAFIQQTAHGVPFAVQLLTEALIKLGPERVQVEFPPQDPQDFDTTGIVQHIVQRFLRYCLDNPVDENRIYALALLRSRDDAVLRSIWQLPENEQPRQVLADLEARYGFIQPGGVLHDIVRDFLRENLRFDAHETAQQLGALAARHYQDRWQTETSGLPILAER